MAVKNTFYDSVGGIAAGEGLVSTEMMMQRKTLMKIRKTNKYEVVERLISITTFLRMHQAMGRVVSQLEEKIVKKRDKKPN